MRQGRTAVLVKWEIHEVFKKLPQIIALRKLAGLCAGWRSQADSLSLQGPVQERRQLQRERILGILNVLLEYSGEY